MSLNAPPEGLYPIIDDGFVTPSEMPHVARALVDAGCHVLQVRLKATDDRGCLELQRQMADALSSGPDVILVNNDRVDFSAVLAREAPAPVAPGRTLGRRICSPPMRARSWAPA